MKFINKTLPDGSVETTCIDDDGIILEVRTHSKETINFLSKVNDTTRYSFSDGIWIPKCNDSKNNTKELKTQKNNPYYLYGDAGKYILLLIDRPYEGCHIEDGLLFESIISVENYIDNNPINNRERYIIKYLNIQN